VSPSPADRSPTAAVRAGWITIGLLCVGLGGVGIVVPGLPTTVFFIASAACFSRSSPRLEAWVLGLRGIGPMVRDHRDGLGMPRRAKVVATACIIGFVSLGIWLGDSHPVVAAGIAGAALVGVGVIWWRVPTREVVAAQGARA
jgi:uncharacterized membrane protein YbaN (DUF454 family)